MEEALSPERDERDIEIPSGNVTLRGILGLPPQPEGVVLFAHGSGSGRFSPRNTMVARFLEDGGLATLLIDLLTEEEATDRRRVFDIELLARRLFDATTWLQQAPETQRLPIGYFGASTGAAAALVAAARASSAVRAVVSRGGRPDLAGPYLKRVQAPTLLIVGGRDEVVLELNRQALTQLPPPRELVVVPGATHLFEEPGALEQVAELARSWFRHYLAPTERG
ncbi:MAG: dienelactone hydrolase family protein [Chloroflexi bacterium]|nr:dienelactone hydrolase family protein [Chloroflexota bacterium]